ncbi:MAG: tRNA (adenosine(37)-N6)-threonylcarbamoyltransferase complex ATPase subunit type 1 TsaE [Elusimicrobia bacterium]|nr:tRNA (adenosine(37)-N6)-threonylcarbamoyltransferase complex ATPase subunit type 1 TsaE [Elusimicrobiota bacterium]
MRAVTADTEARTRALGAALGSSAVPGDVLALSGPLGSGKTTFVQGFARGAGFRGAVVSPSFGLARRYRAPTKTIHHLDLYRLADKDLPNLGLEEYFDDPRGVCLVEWPEIAAKALPPDRLEIRFDHAGERRRKLAFRALGGRARRLLRSLET